MYNEILTVLGEYAAVYYAFCFVLGLSIGSFLNVVIHRLPIILESAWKNQCNELFKLGDTETQNTFNLLWPRSACPNCGHRIGALENIPLISYLIQKGKCRNCAKAISLRYPTVEILAAVLSVVAAYKFGVTWTAVAAMALSYALIALTFIDLDHFLLPDNITLPFLWLGLLLNLFGVFTDLQSSVIGAMAGYLSLWSVYHLFKLVTGKEGMGYGDFKLLAVFGAWFGWQSLPAVILLSSVVGAVIGISLILFRGHQRNIPIPFGPYLAIAGWIVMLWGTEINQAYLRWLYVG